MVIHAVLAIVNVPFVTAYFTKSVPRQTVDRGKRIFVPSWTLLPPWDDSAAERTRKPPQSKHSHSEVPR